MRRIKGFFTLIELIVVIVILGILAAIVIPNVASFKGEATETAVVSDTRNIQTATDMFIMKNNNDTPTKETPTIGNPQTIELFAMKPKYLRTLPKTEGIHYWLDSDNTVWSSRVDAPTNVVYDSTNKKLTWKTVDGATLYKIYTSNDAVVTSAINGQGIKYLKDFTPMSGVKNQELDLPALSSGFYLVSSVDMKDSESPAIKVNSPYKGYQEADKDYTFGTTVEVTPAKPPAPIEKTGLYFDGNDFATISDSPFDFTNNFTLEANVTMTNVNGQHDIVSKWGAGGINMAAYHLSISNGLACISSHDAYIGNDYVCSTTVLQPNVQYHIVGLIRNGTAEIYVNGKLEATKKNFILPQQGNYPLTLGMEGNHPYGAMNGTIHQVRVWNKPLTKEEVASLSSVSEVSDKNGLILHYDFLKQEGNTIYDLSGNNYNATITGATWIK